MVGSGYYCKYDDVDYILTAAHNLVDIKYGRLYEKYKNIRVFRKKFGDSAYQNELRISKVVYHEKFDGQADSGFDIAICKVHKLLPGKNVNEKYFLKKETVYDNFQGYFLPE